MRAWLKAAAVLQLALSGAAWGGTVADCDGALVMSTYNRFDSEHVDWRLASHVSKEDYEQITHDEGANAVIYGVPAGETYSDFQNRVNRQINDLHLSLTREQAHNVMWTGLDPNSKSAYSDCLQAKVLTSSGLHLAVGSATSSDIALIVSWVPRGSDPRQLQVLWSSPSLPAVVPASLPQKMMQGEKIVVLRRPEIQATLALNAEGFGQSVTLEPLPSTPPKMNNEQAVTQPIVLNARDYDRSRAIAVGLITETGNPNFEWGEAITSTGPGVGKAFWDVNVPKQGTWAIYVEYASAESRPVDVYLDQLPLAKSALTLTTATFCVDGSWTKRCPDGGTTRFEEVGRPRLTQGGHTLLIEAGPVFPHIRSVELTFVSAK